MTGIEIWWLNHGHPQKKIFAKIVKISDTDKNSADLLRLVNYVYIAIQCVDDAPFISSPGGNLPQKRNLLLGHLNDFV